MWKKYHNLKLNFTFTCPSWCRPVLDFKCIEESRKLVSKMLWLKLWPLSADTLTASSSTKHLVEWPRAVSEQGFLWSTSDSCDVAGKHLLPFPSFSKWRKQPLNCSWNLPGDSDLVWRCWWTLLSVQLLLELGLLCKHAASGWTGIPLRNKTESPGLISKERCVFCRCWCSCRV